MGNALIDIMTNIPNDSILDQFNLPKGSMQLVNAELSGQIVNKVKQYKPKTTAGGSAANTVHGLGRLGVPCGFIGKLGRDEFGDLFKSDLEKSGITPHIHYSSTESGRAVAFISPDSERTFATYLGAAVEMSSAEIDPSVFSKYDYFYIEGYMVQDHDLIETAIKTARSLSMKIAIDLASYNVVAENLDFLHRISREYVDMIFANEEEAKAFTGKDAESAVKEISTMCDIAVVKVGKRGSIIRQGDKEYHVSVIDANCIDTTGAGDLYAAGFLYGMSLDYDLERCGKIGALLSGKVIENIGAQITDANWETIKDELKKL